MLKKIPGSPSTPQAPALPWLQHRRRTPAGSRPQRPGGQPSHSAAGGSAAAVPALQRCRERRRRRRKAAPCRQQGTACASLTCPWGRWFVPGPPRLLAAARPPVGPGRSAARCAHQHAAVAPARTVHCQPPAMARGDVGTGTENSRHTSALTPCNTARGRALSAHPVAQDLEGPSVRCLSAKGALHISAFFRAADPNSADYGLDTQRIPHKAVCSSPPVCETKQKAFTAVKPGTKQNRGCDAIHLNAPTPPEDKHWHTAHLSPFNYVGITFSKRSLLSCSSSSSSNSSTEGCRRTQSWSRWQGAVPMSRGFRKTSPAVTHSNRVTP